MSSVRQALPCRTPVDGPRPLGICLERPGHAVTALRKSLYFKGHPASLATGQPTWCRVAPPSTHPTCWVYGRVRVGSSFLICRECQCLTSWDMEDSEDCPRLLQADPNVFPGTSWPHRGLFMIISHPLWFPIFQAVVLISLKQPKCQWEGLMARAQQ